MTGVLLLYEDNLNLKDFNTGDRAKMEDNTSKQEPKVRWTRLLKSTFKTKVNKTKIYWTRIFETNED